MGLIAWLEEHESTLTFLIGLSGAAAISALMRATDTPLEFQLPLSWWIFVFWWTLFGPLLGVHIGLVPPISKTSHRREQRFGIIILTAHIILALVSYFVAIVDTRIMALLVIMGFLAPLFGGILMGSGMAAEHQLEAEA